MINIDELLKEIDNAKINEEINLEKYNHTSLERMRFTQESEISNGYNCETRGKYSWVAYNNGNYSYRTVFPSSGNYVTFFKTLAGAKRNFINRYIKERE